VEDVEVEKPVDDALPVPPSSEAIKQSNLTYSITFKCYIELLGRVADVLY